MSKVLLLFLVLFTGALQPFQIAMNTRLAKDTHSPMVAAFVSFAGGLSLITLVWLTGVGGRGDVSALRHTPGWAWLTGVLGVLIVTSALVALPQTGAALAIALIVLGQAAASLAMDHYGWLGVPKIPINLWRVGGAVLILGGTLAMQKR